MVVRIAAGVFALGAAFAAIAAEQPYAWSLGPSLPEATQEIYPAVLNGDIYVAGGLSENEDSSLSISKNVYRLRAKDEQWKSVAPLPQPRHHAMLVSVGNSLWSFGGFIQSEDGQWTNTNTVLQYDDHTDKWQLTGTMPQFLSETVAAVIDGKVHLAGGRVPKQEQQNGSWRDHIDTGWHGIFDPKSQVWQTAAPLPTPRNSACSVVIDERWHVIGGRTVKGGNLTVHEIFDASTNTWKQGTPLPEARGGLACASDGNAIFVFGGEFFEQEGGVFAEVWRYDVAKNRWESVSVMPVPRHGLGAVYLDSQFWLIGGAAKAGAVNTKNTVSKLRPGNAK